MHGFGVETDQCGNAIAVAFRQSTMGISIDDFVRLFAPPLPNHVEINVDGIEAAIQRGGRDTLSARSVKSMIVEIEGDLGSDHNRAILALIQACRRAVPRGELRPGRPMNLSDACLFRQQCYIRGAWHDADSGKTIGVRNPATGKTIVSIRTHA